MVLCGQECPARSSLWWASTGRKIAHKTRHRFKVMGGCKETATYVATSRNDESIVRALLDAGAMVNGRTSDGSTPLHSAADQGTADMVEALIDAGAEINARSAAGLTPLQLAVRRNWVPGCDQVISVLIEAGADLDGQSEEMLRMKWLSMDEIESSTPSDHSGD